MFRKIFCLLFVLWIGFSNSKAQDIPKWKIGDVEAYIKNSNKPTVVNFWATYCKPCIAEIPHFLKLVKKYEKDSVQLLLVSLDMEETYPAIKAFAQKFQFTAPIIFLNETNADVFCPAIDDKWSGAIPATLFINNKTGYRKFIEAEIPEQKFDTELKSLIGLDGVKKSNILLTALLASVFVISLFFLFRNRRNGRS